MTEKNDEGEVIESNYTVISTYPQPEFTALTGY